MDHLLVEDNFLPEVGFLRRDNFRRTYTSGRFSPRPQSIASVRQFSLEGGIDYILTADENHLETRQNIVAFQTEFESSDQLTFTATDNYELLVEPFTPPGSDFSIPVGGYSFAAAQISYSIGQQRRINGSVAVKRGDFFDGDLTTVQLSQGRIAVLPQMSVEPTVSFNWIDTPYGEYQTNLAVTRVNYAFNPRNVLQRPAAVQLGQQLLRQQPAPAVGVQPRQRAVRGLHRRPRRHRGVAARPGLGPAQPRLRRQVQPAVPILTGLR